MREICTSGLTRGSNGIGESRPLLSTLLVNQPESIFQLRILGSIRQGAAGCLRGHPLKVAGRRAR